ncbi:alpha/beta hydrolase [Microterricola viridarii]|nr:alpha/beta hydrolase fold domain-containing protein [Microterricola viridarii]
MAPLLWVHGGAFIGGGLDQNESHAVALGIAATGRPVITVDYRLAPAVNWLKPLAERDLKPGTRYPAALDDVSAALQWIANRAPHVVLGGASAGAALAAATVLRNRDSGGFRPDALALAYGTFHSALPEVSPALRRRIRGWHGITQFRPSTVDRMNLNYAGSHAALTDPYAFPGNADVTGFPPTLLLDADRDSLRSSGEKFRDELTSAGVHTRHQVVPRSRHGFLDRPGRSAYDIGFETIIDWLASHDPEKS